MKIVIIDDEALVRVGLAELVGHEFEVVGQARNGREGLELCRRLRPEVAVIDVVMPIMDGPACTRAIVAEQLPTRVLAVTSYDTNANVFEMLAAGASGFVLKDIEPEALVRAIKVVAQGQALLAPSAVRHLIERFGRPGRGLPTGPDALSERELEVLVWVAQGLKNQEIASAARVSVSTIKTHVSRLLAKLDCRDRAQLVIAAYEMGVVRTGGRR